MLPLCSFSAWAAWNERALHEWLLLGLLVLAAVIVLVLLFVTAPYGRHARAGWGPTLPSRWAWVVMEAPAALLFAACFALGAHRNRAMSWVFLALWESHYVHRAFIYPFRRRESAKGMPLVIVGSGFLFNSLNAYLNGRYLFTYSGGYPLSWLGDTRFLIGGALFVSGYVVNRWADHTLRQLRRPGESGYSIPYGGLYRWISCPNYLGEIVEWTGWAIATWSLPGLAFAVWTTANLLPRARVHHQWYQEQFPNYPAERRALIPRLL